MVRTGKLFVISAPSGSGKTTLCEQLIGSFSETGGLVRSVSATTRKKRKGERHGRDYFFISPTEFIKKKKAGQFLEWARVLNNYYGTPKDFVVDQTRQGRDVLLSIDVRGARKIRRKVKNAVFIFILPPSMPELKRRLKQRSTESRSEISRRLALAKQEMSFAKEYDYMVLNDKVKQALHKLKQIVRQERERQ